MRRLLRIASAPYRALWNIALDCALGAEEPFEYRYSTTPDDEFGCDHRGQTRLP